MSKLARCPFCGGKPTLELFNDGFFDYARISCCHLTFDWCDDTAGEAAIAAWNRRADHLPDATKMVSNADLMRAMSDEELAKWMALLKGDTVGGSAKFILEWLKQPVKEEV